MSEAIGFLILSFGLFWLQKRPPHNSAADRAADALLGTLGAISFLVGCGLLIFGGEA